MSTIAKDQTQVNERIRAKELRLIGQDGDQIGVKSKREALEMAERVDLDLVVVAPNAKPPVARIMDYGKYQFNGNESLEISGNFGDQLTPLVTWSRNI
ncbi:translation initiation factor IF-3, partial [Staphylococcus capitis]|uniref:translation initiation factor IF-3 n=1 Tax=Staphylococcus capitis TaxID=29388 RepID=UPI003D018D95